MRKIWSDAELEASVNEYLRLRDAQLAGKRLNKAEIYRQLSESYGRSPGAFERRFGNISFVLACHGREWVQGHKPLSNVGRNNFLRLEKMIFQRLNASEPMAIWEEVTDGVGGDKGLSAPPKGNKSPKHDKMAVTRYIRDARVVDWIIANSAGICEACQTSAPFVRATDGQPFLEVHHMKRLCDGGPDTVDNAIAVCPNCHRHLHYGQNYNDLKNEIYKRISRLRR
jgi:5-methylcytosine-specific restriction protein A